MYAYSAAQWMLLFYFYCVVGWCFESTVVSFGERRFVNRGFLHGPMLPLYGTGAILLILVSIPLRGRSPVVLFLAGMIAATALEYVTGVVMEAIFGVKYWDYSTHRFQFQGRICLQSSLAWGALTLIVTEWIHPFVERFVLPIQPSDAWILAISVSIVFATDVILSVHTALGLTSILREMTRLRGQADKLRRELSAHAEETRKRLAEATQETRKKLADAASERSRGLQKSLDASIAAYEQRMHKMRFSAKMLLRAHPSAVSARFGKSLEELKERINNRE